MRDVLTAPSTRGRYALEERWGADGPGERYLGTDRRLERTVLLWEVEAPAGDPRRETLVALARRAARLTHPAFLRVVDAVVGPEAALIVLEAPGGPLLTPDQFTARGLPVRVAAEITLQVGRALEQASSLDLRLRTPSLTHLYCDDASGVRLDPLGLLMLQDDREATPSLVPALLALLASLVPDAPAGPGAATSTGGAVRPFLTRWSRQGTTDGAHLQILLAELQMIAAPLDVLTLHPVSPDGSGPGLGESLSPTVDVTMPLPAAAAVRRGETTARYRVTAPLARPPSTPRSLAHGRSLRAAAAGMLIGAAVFGGAVWGTSAFWDTEAGPRGSTQAKGPTTASLTLKAQRDARVRVTVDGTPVYSGVLKTNETRSWQGASRVQVWTADGKALHVTVNGYPLGPLSAAVGHPEWNTVDWGWPAGWKP